MSFFKNASIRTKILSLILPLCLVGLGAVAFMASRYKEADTLNSKFITSDNAALIKLAQANRNLIALGYSAYQVMAYDAKGAEIKVSKDAYEHAKGRLFERLNTVKSIFPEEAAEMDSFLSQSKAIVAMTDKAVELGLSDRNQEAAAQLLTADAAIKATSAAFTAQVERLEKGIAAEAEQMSVDANSTIVTSLGTVGIAF
ncbi:methyl-accepting chemotaxis protein, partial [Agrobacterium sp. DKPNP3]